MVAKAEHLPGKSNPRFVVTSLPASFSARTVYERVYCPRGKAENAIKEQQLDLFSDRTSSPASPPTSCGCSSPPSRRHTPGW